MRVQERLRPATSWNRYGRLLLVLATLLWATGQLTWAGWLLSQPPRAFVPESPLSATELALWLLASAFLGMCAATLVATNSSPPWAALSLLAAVAWLAFPLRLAIEEWLLLGTVSFDPFVELAELPWPVREGWLAWLILCLLVEFVRPRRSQNSAAPRRRANAG